MKKLKAYNQVVCNVS